MHRRPYTVVVCLFATLGANVEAASAFFHALEHIEFAIAGHGHSHPHGDEPHHRHDEDGAPLPVEETTVCLRMTHLATNVRWFSATPLCFAHQTLDKGWSLRIPEPCSVFEKSIPPPQVPAVGHNLPLLI